MGFVMNKHISRVGSVLIIAIVMTIAVSINSRIFAGKLYIKPELELARAARLIDRADQDFRNAKIHMLLSPDISIREFEEARRKYEDAIKIIEEYGAGHYTPGDIQDLSHRSRECSHPFQ